jgi:hypothetical protein
MAERKSFVSEKVKERNKRNREKLKGLGKSILGAFSLDGLRGNKIKPFKKSEFSDEEILKEAKKISKKRTEDRRKEGGKSEDLVGNKDIVQAKKNLKNNTKETKEKDKDTKKETKEKDKDTKKNTKKKEVKKDTKSKKFDYKNKMKTQMSNAKGRKNARGRSSSEIANDPSFMKNTSKGKYLRGIHASLLRQGMASGGVVKKPSTKPSAGNKWN